MGYYNELSFAEKYYSIGLGGIVTLREDTPPDIRKRFWEVWPEFRRKVIDMEKHGIYRSSYPHLPIEEPDPNLHQYMPPERQA